ncbi:hypothetical protein LQL77_31160 [Rhodococcus cerastii]|nr:hypothetical protein [Rhodococcus cerastii]
MNLRNQFVKAALVGGCGASAALAALSPASARTPPDHGTIDPGSVSLAAPCEWSTHNQTGKCVSVQMETQFMVNRPGYFSLRCPASYPYPFLGAFSGNPQWRDQTNGGFVATSSPRAVAMDNSEGPGLSWQGKGSAVPGYVTVFTSDVQPGGEGGYNRPLQPWTVGGTYVCTTTLGTW